MMVCDDRSSEYWLKYFSFGIFKVGVYLGGNRIVKIYSIVIIRV